MTPVNSERAGSDVSELVTGLKAAAELLDGNYGTGALYLQAASALEQQARRIAVLEGALQEIVDADERWVQHASAALEETP